MLQSFHTRPGHETHSFYKFRWKAAEICCLHTLCDILKDARDHQLLSLSEKVFYFIASLRLFQNTLFFQIAFRWDLDKALFVWFFLFGRYWLLWILLSSHASFNHNTFRRLFSLLIVKAKLNFPRPFSSTSGSVAFTAVEQSTTYVFAHFNFELVTTFPHLAHMVIHSGENRVQLPPCQSCLTCIPLQSRHDHQPFTHCENIVPAPPWEGSSSVLLSNPTFSSLARQESVISKFSASSAHRTSAILSNTPWNNPHCFCLVSFLPCHTLSPFCVSF